MRVKIGPHLSWIGPYQIADALFGWPEKYTLDSDETWRHRRSHQLGTWLATTWVADFCEWIQDKRKRYIYVHIDSYDVWGADHTLSLIALPLLKKLQEHKHGAPHVDDEDVPKHLQSTNAPAKENSWDTDALWFDRWDWVLDEMIYAHSQEVNDDPEEAACWTHNLPDPAWPFPNPESDRLTTMLGNTHCDDDKLRLAQARKQNGFRLFGKYYQALWD